MELVSEFSQFEQGSSTRRVKSRSKACLHCRRRKMRCDGVKPACFQCVRAERANECEYDDGITKTDTQLLYERLAMLEKRYRDLQAAKRTRKASSSDRGRGGSPSNTEAAQVNLSRSNSAPDRVHTLQRVTGHEPYEEDVSSLPMNQRSAYSGHSASSSTYTGSNVHIPNTRRFEITGASLGSHSGTHSGRSTPSSSEFPHPELSFDPNSAFTYGYQQVPNADPAINLPYDDPHREMGVPIPGMQKQLSPELFLDIGEDGDVPPATLEHLADCFVSHSFQGGSPLVSSRLIEVLSYSTSDITSSLACALNCIFLWGAQFSPVETVRARKKQFLFDALATLPPLLSSPLSVSPDWATFEAGTAHGRPRDDRYNIVIAINISTILATYFFSQGRNIEGAYHANTACRLALCAGLHHTPDPRLLRDSPPNSAGVLFDSGRSAADFPQYRDTRSSSFGTELLPFPASVDTALERHHIFWNLFVLDRAWSAVGRLPESSSRLGVVPGGASDPDNILKEKDPRTAITTPWPQDWGLLILEESEDDMSPPSLCSAHTIEDFLNGVEARPTHSILQLRAKGAALFEAAARISSLYDPYNPKPGIDAPFATLQRTISTFMKTLPQPSKRSSSQPSFAKSSPYTIHTLVHAAIIRLYSRFAERAYKEGYRDNHATVFAYSEDSQGGSARMLSDVLLGYDRVLSTPQESPRYCSMGRCVGMACAAVDQCLSSARDTARIASCIAPEEISFLEPIIAPCWGFASEILIRELRRVWSIPSIPSIPQVSAKAGLLSDIHTLESSLSRLGSVFPIGNTEARKVTEALSNITNGDAMDVL